MRIEITQSDIDRQEHKHPAQCAAALAARRAVRYPCEVYYDCLLTVGGPYFLPKEVAAWVDRNHRGLPVEPIGFDLDVKLPPPR